MSRVLFQLAITIWTWGVSLSKQNIIFPAKWTHRLMRSQRDCYSWKLNQLVFQQIDELDHWKWNCLHHAWISSFPAFTRSRSRGDKCFPAEMGSQSRVWCLIHQCLTKVRKEGATIVLIIPLWKNLTIVFTSTGVPGGLHNKQPHFWLHQESFNNVVAGGRQDACFKNKKESLGMY